MSSSRDSGLESHPEIRLIHLNDGAMASASLWMQKELDIPVVVTYHGLDVTFPLDFYQDKLIPKLEQYDAAICVSEYTRQQCLKRGFDPEHTYTVPNGVDVSLADKPDRREEITEELLSRGVDVRGKRVIIASGRSVRRKGFSWFIKNVMPSLGSDVVLLMTGPRRQEQSFMQSVTRYIPWSSSSVRPPMRQSWTSCWRRPPASITWGGSPSTILCRSTRWRTSS